MPKRTISFLVLLLLLAAILGLNYFYTPFQRLEEAQVELAKEEEQRESSENQFNTDQILAEMTDQEKVGQLLAVSVFADSNNAESAETFLTDSEIEQALTIRPGFFTIFGSDISAPVAKKTIAKLKDNSQNSKVTPWIGVDHEGGNVQRLNGQGFTVLDSWYDSCNSAKSEVELNLRRSATELKNAGVDIVYAPVIDVGPVREPMGERLCSTDPNQIAERATLFMNTFRTQGVTPVLKHFPGIGSIKEDLHNTFTKTTVGIEDVYLYNNLLQYFPDVGVMTAHVGLTNQHSDIPCSLSQDCVGELLAKYPTVLVIADSLEMDSAFYLPVENSETSLDEADTGSSSGQLETAPSVSTKPSITQIAKQAIVAGNDVLLFGPSTTFQEMQALSQDLVKEYHEDTNFKQRVDDSVRKVLSYKLIKQ